MASWSEAGVSEEHAEHLESQAITPEMAVQRGIKTILRTEDLPPGFENYGERVLPALLFPWVDTNGKVFNQIKIPEEVSEELEAKYLWRKGEAPEIGVFRDTATPVPGQDFEHIALLVEGTKQSIVAGEYAPKDVEVYGIGGCRMWSREGTPSPQLEVFDGKNVYVILDADAATNIDVYRAGESLREALLSYGASDVIFIRLPVGKKAGLDDYIASVPEHRRYRNMENLVRGAVNIPKSKAGKPADTAPKPKRSDKPHPLQQIAAFDATGEKISRVTLTGNPRLDIHSSISAVKDRWDERKLFNYGGVISRFLDGKVIPQNKDSWKNTLVEAADFETYDSKGEVKPATPSQFVIDATFQRMEDFATLKGVKHAPFVRDDGTICTKKGYDKKSQVMLYPSEDLGDIAVPDDPSPAQISTAKGIIDDWLHDFFRIMPAEADRANLVALILTPFVRLSLPSCPLAVINGLQMGVGKNLLADGVSLVYNGQRADPLQLVLETDEQRKQLTASFSQGLDMFIYDEAHVISGKPLASALTAPTWGDRRLGQSLMVSYPNQATWLALGNRVRVEGDIQRRVYPINLKPDTPNPDLRPASSFRHPDFRRFTMENRSRLLQALLTLIRAWHSKGRPSPSAGVSFGSFEMWEKTLGGILEVAGYRGFLENRSEFRSESAVETSYWEHHFDWLFETFGSREFTTREVGAALRNAGSDAEYPPGLLDAAAKDYPRQLGGEYSRMKDRFVGEYRLEQAGTQSRSSLWKIIRISDGGDPPPPDEDDNRGGEPPAPWEPEPEDPTEEDVVDPFEEEVMEAAERVAEKSAGLNERLAKYDGETATCRELVWDIEAGSKDELHDYEGQYVRLSGWRADGGEDVITPDASAMREMVEKAGVHVGFNSIDYDNIALAKYTGADYRDICANSADLIIIERQVDPPGAKGFYKKGYYSLNQTAQRLGHEGKTDDIKRLAKKYGGFDKIPQDDPEYISYLKGDLEATQYVWDRRKKYFFSDPYIRREHDVQARLSYGVTQVGMRIDQPELTRRLNEQAERKKKNFTLLGSEYGIPLRKPNGDPVKSPFATKQGKQRLEELFREMGARHMIRTKKSNDISTNKEALSKAVDFYSNPVRMKAKNINPDTVDSEGIKNLCEIITDVTTERTVYGTIRDHLKKDGRVHPKILPEQGSGRWSLTEPGVTVMGKRGGKYVEREVFLPDYDDEVNIAVDLDQIDARCLAGHSQDPNFMAMFEPGKDLHTEVAMMIFGRADYDPETGIDWRESAKAGSHGIGYGMGVNGMVAQLGLEFDVATQFKDQWTANFPVLEEWKAMVREKASAGDLLDNGFGRMMRPDPARAYTQGPGLMGQGATRDVMAEWILNLDWDLVGRVKAVVHDEVIFSVPGDDWEEYRDRILAAVPREFKGVPITAGCSKPANSWGGCYAKD